MALLMGDKSLWGLLNKEWNPQIFIVFELSRAGAEPSN
jgi:hypothetical protein